MWLDCKTNWQAKVSPDGEYLGDYFNAADYNRIVNNLAYLHTLAEKMYRNHKSPALAAHKEVGAYYYADELNSIEDGLEKLNVQTVNTEIGNKKTFMSNGPSIDFNELNRIESAMLNIYGKLTNQYDGRRKLKFKLGTKGGF